jgi:hypothetical protein
MQGKQSCVQRTLRLVPAKPPSQLFGIKRPFQFGIALFVAQHRYADAVALFEFVIVVDEYAFELRHARLREHIQREVAQVAIVALEQDQTGFRNGHEQFDAVWRNVLAVARRIVG